MGGSNHPLRGGKGSNWEGGVRVPTFVTGGYLPAVQRGKTHDGIIHIADWLSTFAAVAGIDPNAGEPHPVAPLDSINAWPWLSGAVPTSGRTEVVFDHRMFANVTKQRSQCYVVNTTSRPSGEACVSAAIRQNNWKLVVGPEKQNGWFGWFSPNVSNPVSKHDPAVIASACFPVPCLFDLGASITEHEDVAAQHPEVVAAMLRRVVEIAEDEYHPPVLNPPIDLDGYCAAVEANKNFVGPWMRVGNEFL